MISFKNTPFKINGTQIYATQASLSEKVDYARVEGLGYTDVGLAQSSRPEGEFSAEFYIREGEADFFMTKTGLVQLNGAIGGVTFETGYMEEFSLSIEPLSLIKANVKGRFFGPLTWGNPEVTPNDSEIEPDSDFAHGAKSTIANHADAISLSYSVSQSVEPSYVIGSTEIIGFKYRGGQITVGLGGTGLQTAVDYDCESGEPNVTINLNSICGGELDVISNMGFKVTNSSISVSASEDLVGNMELIKYI